MLETLKLDPPESNLFHRSIVIPELLDDTLRNIQYRKREDFYDPARINDFFRTSLDTFLTINNFYDPEKSRLFVTKELAEAKRIVEDIEKMQLFLRDGYTRRELVLEKKLEESLSGAAVRHGELSPAHLAQSIIVRDLARYTILS